MGGTGIAVSHGAESTISNPAMISTVEGTEISFGGTIFMPTVKTTINPAGNAFPSQALTSDADMNMIRVQNRRPYCCSCTCTAVR